VVTTGGGADVVNDFAVGTDKIDATAYGAYQSIAQSGSDTVITFAAGVTLTLKGVSASGVTAASFIGLTSATPPPPSGVTVNGTAGADSLSGGTGNDTLNGYGGNDRLYGNLGADSMYGGTGDDSYIVDNPADVIVEKAGEGAVSVLAYVSYTLSANLENLTLMGSAAIDGTGNGLDNYLKGNTAANVLSGGAGNDILIGNLGADTMKGGTGNDLYYIDDVGDVIVENVGEGTDRVTSSITYTLPANVEHLALSGSAAINATGNGLTNALAGNSAANVLDGDGGADVLTGGAGDDTFVYNALSDSAPSSHDRITDFDSAHDHIDLSAIDANTGLAGDQAFAFVGAFDHHAGQAVLSFDAAHNQTTLTLDVNGDAVADFALLITGHPLAGSGFIL